MGAQPVSLRKPSRMRFEWALPLVPVALAVFFVSSLSCYHVEWSNSPFGGDTMLQQLVVSVYRFFGFVPAMMFSVMVLVWGSIGFLTGKVDRPLSRFLRILAFVVSLSLVVNLGSAAHSGWLGKTLAVPLDAVFGGALSTLLAAVAALGSLMLATDFLFYRYFDSLGAKASTPSTGSAEGAELSETVSPANTEPKVPA